MKKNTKLLTAISTTAIALSLIAPAAISVSAAQNTSATTTTKTSNDWNNAEKWSPDQIASFMRNADQPDIPDHVIDANTQVKHDNAAALSQQQIQSIDKFVSVENNQYVLSIPANSGLTEQQITEAQKEIATTNQAINKDNYSINPTTKIGESRITTRSYAHEIDYLWYGTRHIFRTNAAVSSWTSTLNQLAAANAGAAVIAGAVFGGVGAVPNGLTSAWTWAVAAYTDGFNASHKNSHIAIYTTYAVAYWGTTWA